MGEEQALLGLAGAALVAACVFLARPGRSAREAAWRNRVATLALVAALVLLSHAAFPDPQRRIDFQYLFTITLGYGHLIGAAVFSRGRLSRFVWPGAPPRLFAAFVAVSVVTLFAAYSWAVSLQPNLFVALLAVSVWHTSENDLALERAYAEHLRLGPIARAADPHLVSVGLASLLILMAAMTPSWTEYAPAIEGTVFGWLGVESLRVACIGCGAALVWRHRVGARGLLGAMLIVGGMGISEDLARWVRLADLFVMTTLYHLVSWLVFFADRAHRLRERGERKEAAAMWRRIAWVHAPPALLCVWLLWPAEGLTAVRFAVFSPAVYLFWSVLHVVQTALARGLEPRAQALRQLPVLR